MPLLQVDVFGKNYHRLPPSLLRTVCTLIIQTPGVNFMPVLIVTTILRVRRTLVLSRLSSIILVLRPSLRVSSNVKKLPTVILLPLITVVVIAARIKRVQEHHACIHMARTSHMN